MICLGCGSECGESRYCTECGTKRAEIVKAVRKFPEDVRSVLDKMMLCIDRERVNEDTRNDGPMIMAVGDVVLDGDEQDLANARIYSTGSVMFSPTNKMYDLEFYYDGNLIQAAPFYSTACVRREWGEEKCIRLYTDYYSYCLDESRLSTSRMRTLSRKGIFISRCKDVFYVYTNNENEGYLSSSGHPWPAGRVTEVPLNMEIRIGDNASFRITR